MLNYRYMIISYHGDMKVYSNKKENNEYLYLFYIYHKIKIGFYILLQICNAYLFGNIV